MGGRVLEYEAKTILKRGITQGKMELVDVMLKKGKSYEEISELTDIPIDRLKRAAKASGRESRCLP